jgi:hypothetical protein
MPPAPASATTIAAIDPTVLMQPQGLTTPLAGHLRLLYFGLTGLDRPQSLTNKTYQDAAALARELHVTRFNGCEVLFDRLAPALEDVAAELWQFAREEHVAVRQRHLSPA